MSIREYLDYLTCVCAVFSVAFVAIYIISLTDKNYTDSCCEVIRIYETKGIERVEFFLEDKTDSILRKNVVFDDSTFLRKYTGVCSRFWGREELHITKADYLALVKKE